MQILKNDNFADFQTANLGIDLFKTFNCGQCFRWEKVQDGYFEGVAFNKFIRVKQEKNILLFENILKKDFQEIWQNYFDLENNYDKIIDSFNCDEILKKVINFSKGIHILKQDIFEVIVSFIISANNNIARIKKIINLLCQNFGEKINYKNNVYYSFPTAKILSELCLKDLDVIRGGFRSKYILDAAKKVYNGDVDLEKITILSNEEAIKELMKIKGVGEKVAHCILLFGLNRYDAFPKDVWIKRIMNNCYGDCECSRFGEYAGVAQQYLYFYAKNKIK